MFVGGFVLCQPFSFGSWQCRPSQSIRPARNMSCCAEAPLCSSVSKAQPSRRALLGFAGMATALAAVAHLFGEVRPANAEQSYQVHKPRYIPQGRPPPTMPPPKLDPSLPLQTVQPSQNAAAGASAEPLRVQDAEIGSGDKVIERGTLVLAKWTIQLEDGSVIEDTPSVQLFRAGVSQTYPGLDAALIGMRQTGSVRRVIGPATSFFSDITSGERALAPSDSVVYATIRVFKCNPYGVPQ